MTSNSTISPNSISEGKFIAKANGIIAEIELISKVYSVYCKNRKIDDKIIVKETIKNGESCRDGEIIAKVIGNTRVLIECERVILNLLQRTCGIATMTNHAIKKLNDKSITILDTRKTAPGLRIFDKRAVEIGGGKNHRIGLYDAIMIKDNHITAAGSIKNAVNLVHSKYGDKYSIEIEVKNKSELLEAIECKPDIIMLDNMSPDEIRELTKLVPKNIKTEGSGGINLDNIAEFRGTRLDYISLGFLTHSVKALDISFLLNIT